MAESSDNKFVTHGEFTQFERSVDSRFDDLSNTVTDGFREVKSVIGRMQDSRSTQWGPIISAVLLLLTILALYVSPVKSQADSLEQRVWNVETSFVPEEMIKTDMQILSNLIHENIKSDTELAIQSAERWGRTDARLDELEIEVSRMLNDLYTHYWGDVYENRIKALESKP